MSLKLQQQSLGYELEYTIKYKGAEWESEIVDWVVYKYKSWV